MVIIDLYEYDLFCIIQITKELEESNEEIKDYQIAIEKIYECVEGYFGIASDIENFMLDENNEIIEHRIEEYENFYETIYKEIIQLYVDKINKNDSEYKRGFEDGLVAGYQGRDRIADLEEDVQNYR